MLCVEHECYDRTKLAIQIFDGCSFDQVVTAQHNVRFCKNIRITKSVTRMGTLY